MAGGIRLRRPASRGTGSNRSGRRAFRLRRWPCRPPDALCGSLRAMARQSGRHRFRSNGSHLRGPGHNYSRLHPRSDRGFVCSVRSRLDNDQRLLRSCRKPARTLGRHFELWVGPRAGVGALSSMAGYADPEGFAAIGHFLPRRHPRASGPVHRFLFLHWGCAKGSQLAAGARQIEQPNQPVAQHESKMRGEAVGENLCVRRAA